MTHPRIYSANVSRATVAFSGRERRRDGGEGRGRGEKYGLYIWVRLGVAPRETRLPAVEHGRPPGRCFW